jgi:flagellar basal-body rod modification protein FlgD
MDMDVNGATSGANDVQFVDASQTGLAALTSEGFLELLITQLQNQDPSEPIGNEELLNQISAMRELQSNIELSDTLKSLTSNQQLSTAAAFIGKSVSGNVGDQLISGTVDRAFLRDGTAYVSVGDTELPLNDITDVTEA